MFQLVLGFRGRVGGLGFKGSRVYVPRFFFND